MAWEVSSFVQEGFEKLRSDYNAAKVSRFRRQRAGVSSVPRHADYHYRMEFDWFRMMELHRDYDRNDVVVGQGITRVVDNALQDVGITPDANTPDVKLNRELNARWREEAESAELWDLQGEEDFSGLENDVARSMLVDGDMIGLGTHGGPIELAEAHRLRTPLRTRRNIVHGVELDPVTRRRLKYWLCQEDVNPLSAAPLVSEMRGIPTRDAAGYRQVFHVYRRKRVSQTRGVSALAPICDIAGMHDDLQFSTLVKAQVAAAFVIFKEMAVNAPGMPAGSSGAQSEETQADGSIRTIEGIAPGMRIQGRPGEKLSGFAPNIPSTSFVPHSILLLTFIAMNLGIPIAILLLDPKLAGNFSSLRGVMDQAKIGLRKLQWKLVERWHRPVREFRLRFWATRKDSEGRALSKAWDLLGDRAFFRCKWRPPRWPYIEPLTDAGAGILRTRNLQQSPRRNAAESGEDFVDVVNETVSDNSYAIVRAKRAAQRINTRFPNDVPVDWKEVLSLPTPDKVNLSLTGNVEQQSAPEPVPAEATS